MNSLQAKIYYRLPYFLKNACVSLLSYKNSSIRKGRYYKKHLEQLRKSWYYTNEELIALQKQQLQKLFLELYKYSSHYKNDFIKAGINEKDIIESDPFAILSRLPFLEKQVLKTSLQQIENCNPERKRDVINFTSGTTGTPAVVYYDKESIQISFALWRRFHDVIGLPQKFRSIRFSGKIIVDPLADKPPYWVYNIVDAQLFMSTYHLSDDRLPYYTQKIESFKPQLIDGYPSALYILAKYINSKNLKFSFKPVAITTTAETLYTYQRTEIEKAFGCKVYNQYASSEGGSFITECVKGKYHLNLDSGYFEFISLNGKRAIAGEFAELIITSFRNLKTPLIKYRTSDIVLLAAEDSCFCGCKMPLVDEITGREDDILYTKDKGYVGRMDTAYKGLTGIEKSQIVQRSPELIDVYQVINAAHYNAEIENRFISNLRERLGNIIVINIHTVTNIPLHKNGKFKAVIREFKLKDFNQSLK